MNIFNVVAPTVQEAYDAIEPNETETFIYAALEDDFPDVTKDVPTLAVGVEVYNSLLNQGFSDVSLVIVEEGKLTVAPTERRLHVAT